MRKRFEDAYMSANSFFTKEERDDDMQKDRSKRALRRQNKKRFDKEDRYD